LEIIPCNFDEKHYEIIAFVCLRMFSGVATKNVTTSGDEQVLHIIEGMQTFDVDISDEESSKGSKGEDDSQALTMTEIHVPPPLVENGKLGYV
jgi:hypothetical protein